MISICFQGKPFSITVIQVYAPTTYVEEAKVDQFHKDLEDLLELTPKNDVLFIIGDWNAKVGVTYKFGFELQNEAGQRLTEFCQENALVIENTLFQQHKRWLYIWTSPNGHWPRAGQLEHCSSWLQWLVQRWESDPRWANQRQLWNRIFGILGKVLRFFQ